MTLSQISLLTGKQEDSTDHTLQRHTSQVLHRKNTWIVAVLTKECGLLINVHMPGCHSKSPSMSLPIPFCTGLGGCLALTLQDSRIRQIPCTWLVSRASCVLRVFCMQIVVQLFSLCNCSVLTYTPSEESSRWLPYLLFLYKNE